MRIECNHAPDAAAEADLFYCGYEDCAPDFSLGPNVRDCYLLHYVEKGRGHYKIGDAEYPLEAGELFVIYPGEVVYYWTERDDPWSFCWFAFDGSGAAGLLERAGLGRDRPTLRLRDGRMLSSCVTGMIAAVSERPYGYETEVRGRLYLALAELERAYRDAQPGTAATAKPAETYAREALRYMAFHYSEPVSVREVAAYVGLERTYFAKLFKTVCGRSPKAHLIALRIDKACTLLRTTALPVSEIGRCVGIDDDYYFSRLFKRVTGQSPSAYRRIAAKNLPSTSGGRKE
ncbi:AraC family transcriptional regulator [Paenibacillus sp. IB182496]|uniref:AraC family transcriptional regulator n=1 Tax=Paenibacillus sabuli TaxID=2772509 RepID=A0A927BXK1_9BACL|nr:AraC family transcriptional regulator [Paenibacillus sabuli]MBD2847580.1 AraC family transcriptional regulator [Paenibacillus sabuli]